MRINSTLRLYITAILIFIFSVTNKSLAQIPTNCFAVTGILVDACGTQEGIDEMLFFQIGPNDLNVSNLTIGWPLNNNPYRGICQDATTATKVAAFNRTILRCGLLIEPTAGVLPAGKKVLLFTSENVDTLLTSFANLQDTIIAIFQCAGNTQGHFANSGTGTRTVTMTFAGTNGCTETGSYIRDSLVNQSGSHSPQDGEGVYFSLSGAATYYWNPCMPPIQPDYVHAGSTITVCRGINPISLSGTADNNQAVHWFGGNGTFSRTDTTVTTYTPALSDNYPLYLYLVRRICATDSLVDSVLINATIAAPVPFNASICSGQTYLFGGQSYSIPGIYNDTIIGSTGCDSISRLNLTRTTPTNISLPFAGCGQVSYGGFTFTSNITIRDTLRSTGGCDSVYLTINITINQPTSYTQTVTVCQGQSITVGTFTHTIPGVYHDTLTNAIGCDSIVITTLANAGSATNAGNDAVICRGDSTQLHATGGLSYTWTPTTGLSNPNIANPIAKPLVTTTYTVSSPVNVGNQISNGDFSNGNTGFNSGYTYTSTPPGQPCGTYGILGCEGYYNVNTSPSNTHTQFTSFGDHTTGTGQMMIVNGATSPNTTVWCQNVTVLPNTSYVFSAWIANVDRFPQTPANVQFTVNGTPVGAYFSPGNNAAGVWSQFFANWNSGSSTSINICLTDSSLSVGGNDFALDDITFAQICNGTDTVQIVVNPTYRDTVSTTICAASLPYTLPDGSSASRSGTYTSHLHTVNACDSFIVTRLTVDTVINQTVNLSGCNQVTYNGNTYTSSTTLNQTTQYLNGCDSLVKTININISSFGFLAQTLNICQGQTVVIGTRSYSSSGFYIDTLRNAAVGGCDSIIHTTLGVLTPYNSSLSIFDTCVGIYHGISYSSSTTVRETITSTVLGCDSVYLVVTINIATPTLTTTTNNVRICPGQTYFAAGQNQSTAGTYYDTTRTLLGGCDSVIQVTNLSILTPQTSVQSFDTCTAVTLHGVAYSNDTILNFTIVSSLGCDSLIERDTVRIKATTITVLSTAVLPILQGDSTQLIINPSGTYQNVIWSPNQWISNRFDPSPYVLPDVTTAYMVSATDANNCPVSGQIIITVTPNDLPDLAMPSAFTPNGDGKNETYGPVLNPNTQITSFHVYNRWGELVFDKDVAGTNDWDGFYKGSNQPTGTYVYFITTVSSSGKTNSREGTFMLFR